MNSSSYLFIVGLFVIAVGVAWILTGGPGADTGIPVPTTPVPAPEITPGTPPPTPGLDTPAQPTFGAQAASTVAQPMTAVPVTTAGPTPQPTAPISSDDIKLHFMDLAFGSGNAYLERLNATDYNGRIVISVSANDDSDKTQLTNAAKEFNSISQTDQLSEMIKDGMNGNIAIKFIPGSGMSAIALNTSDDLANREIRSNGVTTAKLTRGIIYINADLKGDLRNHTLMRGLYYELGVVGETAKYPDSLFYSGDNTNVNLTYVDRNAIGVLYGPGLYHGMTVDDIRKIMYIH
jgi:hypothetical protein